MKYIVDIDDFEPLFKVDSIGVFGIGKSVSDSDNDHSWSRIKSIEEFEELNSDYINEHFGDLQDTAYQRGLDDAWEAARKIADMWTRIDNDELLAIFGITERIGHSTIRAMFEKQTANEAMLELEAYEEKQKAEDEIKVGDEVKPSYSDIAGVVTLVDGDTIYVLWRDGSSTSIIKLKDLRKTGRHFDIDKLLKEMQND